MSAVMRVVRLVTMLSLSYLWYVDLAFSADDPVPALLSQLKSPTASTRESAFYSLMNLGNQSVAANAAAAGVSSETTQLLAAYPADAESIRTAFIGLLTLETTSSDDEAEPDGASDYPAESDYGAYFADVETAVVAIDDVRSLPLLIPLLNGGNMFIDRVVSFGPVALDPVLATIYDQRPEVQKAATFPLVKMTDPANAASFADRTSISKIRAGLVLLFPKLDIPAMKAFAQTGLNRLPAIVRGDLNADGLVNCADLDIIKASFGKSVGQTGFDIRADVNGDGVVNIFDLSAEAKLLPAGTTCQ